MMTKFLLKKFRLLFSFLIFIAIPCLLFPQERFQANWESLKKYSAPDWFRDAKFGIFIHWGVYSVPAFGSEWYPREMYQKDSKEFKHHVATYGTQDTFGYKNFIPLFKAEKFNADQWATLFKEAG